MKEAAWKLYHSAEIDTVKAAALKIILEVNDRLMELNILSRIAVLEEKSVRQKGRCYGLTAKAITERVERLERLLNVDGTPKGPPFDYDLLTPKEQKLTDNIHLWHDVAVRLGYGKLEACRYRFKPGCNPHSNPEIAEECFRNMTEEELKIPPAELVDVEKLRVDGENPNRMSARQSKALKKSVQRWGFIVPIITNRNYLIADGEHRLRAAKDLGMRQVSVVRLPVDDVDRRLLRHVMNKIRGEHDLFLDAEEYYRIVSEDSRDLIKEIFPFLFRVYS